MNFLRVLFWINLAVVGTIGGVHVFDTFDNFHELSQEALYFAGTGLGVVIFVLFNFAVWYSPGLDPLPRRLAHAANVIMVIYGFFAVKAVPEPQVYVGLGALIGLAVAALLLDRQIAENPDKGERSVP